MLNALRRACFRRTRYVIYFFVAWFLLYPTRLHSTLEMDVRFPSELISVRGQDLPGTGGGAEVLDFAISPDDAKLTVAFEVTDQNQQLGVWLAQWEINSRKVLNEIRLPHSIASGSISVALRHDTMQYTRDGSEIIVQAGNYLYAVDSNSLSPIYSTSFTSQPNVSSEG